MNELVMRRLFVLGPVAPTKLELGSTDRRSADRGLNCVNKVDDPDWIKKWHHIIDMNITINIHVYNNNIHVLHRMQFVRASEKVLARCRWAILQFMTVVELVNFGWQTKYN